MPSGILAIVGKDCLHLIDYTDQNSHYSICERKFRKKKFNTISLDCLNKSVICDTCFHFWHGDSEYTPRFDQAHHVISNFNSSRRKEILKPIKIFAMKLAKIQRWAKRTTVFRPVKR